MKLHLEQLLSDTIRHEFSELDSRETPLITIDRTKDASHGDYASNIALTLAKTLKQSPRLVAEKLVQAIPSSPFIEKIDIAGPGFINFFINELGLTTEIESILKDAERYGHSKHGQMKPILVEFISSNPTGPLHVGHGRHAAYGAVVCNLLETIGFKVHREYYVNDAGRQIDILTVSLWIRYLTLVRNQPLLFPFPKNGYQGSYIEEFAKQLAEEYGDVFYHAPDSVFAQLPPDEHEGGDKEKYIDALIANAKQLLNEHYITVFNFGLSRIMQDIRTDLEEFGVTIDEWFSEREFVESGRVKTILEEFKQKGVTYEQDGALWFKASQFGDEKDRVLIRSNGQSTYFGNDAAYHIYKFLRGFDLAIDILGADHHGYLQRTKAAVAAKDISPERLIHLLVQFVSLYKKGELVKMSTRGGNFVTLRELREEVGNDAARFFYVMRKFEQPMDFDMDLAVSQSNENPLYYIQYANARTHQIFKQAKDRSISVELIPNPELLVLLATTEERTLCKRLIDYKDVLFYSATQYSPHILTQYLRDLAADFHSYYNAHVFLVDDPSLRTARLILVKAVQQILSNGLQLLGVSAPTVM